ncbi:MAG: TetR/AcrR family transcriptional regulator [Gemmatimonadota bacterium]|nr:TetR/AcrR family transcriptional regulator [Gemmatimonadota bacterium]
MTDQRERILNCACDLYLEHGLDGFSMRKLAKEIGVTAPAIYRHYDGREAVLADVLREAYRTFSRYLYAALGAPSPLERFSAAGEQYLNFVIEHPRWYGMMHTAPEHLGMDEIPADIEALQMATHQFWLDRVRECMEAGILREMDPEESSITMWAHAHGMVQLFHQGLLPVNEEEFRRLFRESGMRLMSGVATPEFGEEMKTMTTEAIAQPIA